MKITLVCVVALAALVASPSLTQAQERTGDDLSVTAAIAVGSGGLTCGSCDDARAMAPSGYVRIGGPILPGLVLSAEIDAWSKSEEWVLFDGTSNVHGTSRFTIATLNAVAQWYPLTHRGFFVEAGLGVGRYQVRSKSIDIGGSSAYSNTFGYLAGAGYDIPVSDHVAVTPSAKIFGFSGAKIQDVDGKVGGNVAQFALGLTWR
jgi:opacity protein-like surface antigen